VQTLVLSISDLDFAKLGKSSAVAAQRPLWVESGLLVCSTEALAAALNDQRQAACWSQRDHA